MPYIYNRFSPYDVLLCSALLAWIIGFCVSGAAVVHSSLTVENGQELINKLIVDLKDENPNIRSDAAEQLGKTGNSHAVVPLTTVLETDNVWSVRKWAAWALGEINDRRAFDPLIRALQHMDWIIRVKAAEVLGKIGDSSAVEPLISALQDENSYVYSQVTWALGEICDDRAVIPMIEALRKEIPAVRINAAIALGKIGNTTAAEHLAAAMKNDRVWSVRKWSAWALGEIRDERSVEPLIQALKDDNYYVRVYAELSLEKIGRPAVPSLLDALNDQNLSVRNRAAWSLEGITGQSFSHDRE
jgi:HEAT repeat protein